MSPSFVVIHHARTREADVAYGPFVRYEEAYLFAAALINGPGQAGHTITALHDPGFGVGVAQACA